MEQINNSILTVKTKILGAELTSIVKNGVEYFSDARVSGVPVSRVSGQNTVYLA